MTAHVGVSDSATVLQAGYRPSAEPHLQQTGELRLRQLRPQPR